MHEDFEKVLISKEEIAADIARVAAELSRDYEGKNPLFVCILKGSVFFFADLLRAVTIPAEIDFMSISSYGNAARSSGEVKMVKDLDRSIEGRHVIVVEDILDSGNTLSYLTSLLRSRNPASVEICTLLDKPERRQTEVYAKYKGRNIPDEFVVGYGLDYAEKYRNTSDIYVLKRSVYE
jgi:hypoxanthine phosphoribosyltransferase